MQIKNVLLVILFISTFFNLDLKAGCGGFHIQGNKPNPVAIGDTVRMVLVADGSTCPSSYSHQWYHNGSIITGADNIFYLATEPGDYKLEYIANGSLYSDTYTVIYEGVGIETHTKSVIKIFPNITSGIINMEFNETGEKSLIIYNSIGERVVEESFYVSELSCTRDLTHLEKGIYFFHFITDKRKFVIKVIRE